MTVTSHSYSASIPGSPARPLSVRGGSVVLDDSRAPHVTATLDIAMPSQATLDALDARQSPPPRVNLYAYSYPAEQPGTRIFQLHVRDREIRHADGIVTLNLASDEGRLDDYAPLADDFTPYNYRTSLRAVVNYVLNKVIPGRSLRSTPANDADVTPYWDSENLVTDPNVTSLSTFATVNVTPSIDSWPAGNGTRNSVKLSSPTNTDSYTSPGGGIGDLRLGMRPGRTYTFSARGSVRSVLTGSTSSNTRKIVAYYKNAAGSYVATASSAAVPNTAGSDARISVTFGIPVGATEAFVRCYHGASGGEIAWSELRLSETEAVPDTDYFSGSNINTANYAYEWTGPANASTTRRIALIDRPLESLRWQAGQTAMEFLAPIVQAAGLRLVCDESTGWELRDESYTTGYALSIRHGVNMIDGTDRISRDDALWFDAAVVKYAWRDARGNPREATDTYAANTPHSRLVTIERPSAYPGAGFAQYAVRRAQGRGREITVSAVSDWSAHAEQPLVIALEGTPPQVGKTSRIVYDLDTDVMTITARTTDTPIGAIDLLPGTIDSLPGTIDSLGS